VGPQSAAKGEKYDNKYSWLRTFKNQLLKGGSSENLNDFV